MNQAKGIETQSQFVIISGMHRSATSLVTQYLQLCGIALGDNLLGAHKDNQDGYFENKSIVQLHQSIIVEQNRNLFNCPEQASYAESAKKVLLEEAKSLESFGSVYGFKDPRNCLFIQPLSGLFPDAKHLLLYRDYREVIDSLIRRATDKEIRRQPWLAAKAWIKYNECIIKFYKRNQEHSLLFNDSFFIKNSGHCVQAINAKFRTKLTPEPINSIYKPSLTKRDGKFNWKTRLVCWFYRNKLIDIDKELKAISES
ncbi:sulfotransferase [Brumicola blandensis]|uniref:Sulfotransferase n=1 Tax=Brumicola blandensis TaxID=3075611 RepID=A0AAW8R382_9ALTE|nr:sulfotransferase [Alteromonas sp. W409]MDT0582636.1 sulfotransferase [Alteromonas sp. W409]